MLETIHPAPPLSTKDAYEIAKDKGYEVGIPGADHEVYCPELDELEVIL
jgi:ribosome modulation factor